MNWCLLLWRIKLTKEAIKKRTGGHLDLLIELRIICSMAAINIQVVLLIKVKSIHIYSNRCWLVLEVITVAQIRRRTLAGLIKFWKKTMENIVKILVTFKTTLLVKIIKEQSLKVTILNFWLRIFIDLSQGLYSQSITKNS